MKQVTKKLKNLALAIASVSLLSACGGIGESTDFEQRLNSIQGKDIVETAVEAGSFNTLAQALQAANLVDTLKGDGPFTVFAPTDQAFAQLPAATLNALLNDQAALTEVLLYHVVAGRVNSTQVASANRVRTVDGRYVAITALGDGIFLNDSRVITADVEASNGIIHVVDQVLIPPTDIIAIAEKAGNFNTLLFALDLAGLTETVRSGNFTVFAPTDEAFSRIPQATLNAVLADINLLRAVLLYHVVDGEVDAATASGLDSATTVQGGSLNITSIGSSLFINSSQVTAADVRASNGIIHVIDTVLLPQ